MESAIVQTQMSLLKTRIIYKEEIFENNENYEQVLQNLLDDSRYLALSLRYPYNHVDFTGIELPKRYLNWQLRCCEELYNLIGSINIKSYSENGLTWTRDSAYLSTQLVNEIEPMVGTISKED